MTVPPRPPWKTASERPVVLGVGVILLLLGAWVLFGPQSDEVRGAIVGMDEAVLLAFRSGDDPADPWGPRVIEEAMRDITALGGVTVTSFLLLVAVGYLALAGRARTALYLLMVIATGIAMAFLIKTGFDRPRPDLVPHGTHVVTSSFPSGHASTAAVLYLTLGAVLSRVTPFSGQRTLTIVLAVLLTLVVGMSRLYLGVHYPTDVLAGWLYGGGWAVGAWHLERALQRHGVLEPDVGVRK